MVPTVSHPGRWEPVESENVGAVLQEHGGRVLRTWLRYAAPADGHGHTKTTIAVLATQWGVSVA